MRYLLGLLAAVTAFAQADLAQRTRENLDLLLTGDLSKLSAQFDPVMRDKVTPEMLAGIRTSLGQLGSVRSVGTAEIESSGPATSVYLPVDFANGSFRVQFVYDPEGRISGLWMRPPKDQAELVWAAPPYSKAGAFRSREVTFGARGFELPGTLTIPAGKGPFPAAVLVHGSGPQDRDETIGPNKPFRDLAEGLATAGIVVLRYDKRTRVHGGRGLQTVNEEAVEDAIHAGAFLRGLPEVDRARVFVAGHSLGGHLVPRILERDRLFAGAIILAGSVRPLQELVREQAAVVAPGMDPQALVDKIRGAAPESYWKDLEHYDPAALAAKQRIPLLILQGERDYQVTMTDFRLWQKALAARKNVAFKSYPTLNHLFMQGNGPRSNPAEYNHAGHVDDTVVQDIAAFIREK